MPNRGLVSVKETRVEALRAKHAALSEMIEREQHSITAMDYIRQLKKRKLRLKEELEELRGGAGHA